VQDVVIDLRYNGGGYVSLQERLANYLINNAGNGGLMMTQQFNNNMRANIILH
jgi:C-terminal processing protease CtpA/Prc